MEPIIEEEVTEQMDVAAYETVNLEEDKEEEDKEDEEENKDKSEENGVEQVNVFVMADGQRIKEKNNNN